MYAAVDETDELDNDREISPTALLSGYGYLRRPKSRKIMNQDWPIGKLSFNEANPRRRLRDAAFAELCDSIKAQGMLMPLLITPTGTVLAGNRRLAAAHHLKLDTVPVRIFEDRKAIDADLVPLIENLIRSDLTPIDAMNYMAVLRTKWNLSCAGIAKMTGITAATVSKYLRVADGPKVIRQMVEEDRIGITAACELLRYADSELISLLAKKEQVSYKEAQQLIAQIKAQEEGKKAKEAIVEPPAPKRDVITSSGFLFYSNMTLKFIESNLCDVTHVQIYNRLKELIEAISPILTQADQPRKKTKVSDNRTEHPAIVAFKAATGSFPKRLLMDQVIETLGEQPDVTRLNQVFVAWTGRGYNPMNLNWLQWYIEGIPQNGNGKSNGKSYETASSRNVRNISESLDYLSELSPTNR